MACWAARARLLALVPFPLPFHPYPPFLPTQPPSHPASAMQGSSTSPSTLETVRQAVANATTVLVVLDSAHDTQHVQV